MCRVVLWYGKCVGLWYGKCVVLWYVKCVVLCYGKCVVLWYNFASSDMVHGCMVYTERAEMAAVSCDTSHASSVNTLLPWTFKNAL